jgi:nitrite reductase (NADH) small subunit/3-phenylpropionate/trans-cinnamate dioxygenase ferredoxin subunit
LPLEPDLEPDGSFLRVAGVSEIPEGGGKSFRVDGRDIAIFRVDGVFHATSDVCPHVGGPLGEGPVEGGIVICPWHGWAFDVRTGCYAGSRQHGIDRYAVEVRGDDILVDVRAPLPEACAGAAAVPAPALPPVPAVPERPQEEV